VKWFWGNLILNIRLKVVNAGEVWAHCCWRFMPLASLQMALNYSSNQISMSSNYNESMKAFSSLTLTLNIIEMTELNNDSCNGDFLFLFFFLRKLYFLPPVECFLLSFLQHFVFFSFTVQVRMWLLLEDFFWPHCCKKSHLEAEFMCSFPDF
jgi:hypothetical protein